MAASTICVPLSTSPAPVIDLVQVGSAGDVEEFFAAVYLDAESTRGETAVYVDLIRDYDPDVVVDSFGLLPCLAARVLAVPLVALSHGKNQAKNPGLCKIRNPGLSLLVVLRATLP